MYFVKSGGVWSKRLFCCNTCEKREQQESCHSTRLTVATSIRCALSIFAVDLRRKGVCRVQAVLGLQDKWLEIDLGTLTVLAVIS